MSTPATSLPPELAAAVEDAVARRRADIFRAGVAAGRRATGEPAGALLAKAFREGDHPRSDAGQFVGAGALRDARADPKKAEELRATVTDPEQREKLDKAIGAKGPTPAKTKHGNRVLTHNEGGRELVGRFRRQLVDLTKRYRAGEYTTDDMIEDVGIVADRHTKEVRDHYKHAIDHAAAVAKEHYGEAVLETPEWGAVRGAFSEAFAGAKGGANAIRAELQSHLNDYGKKLRYETNAETGERELHEEDDERHHAWFMKREESPTYDTVLDELQALEDGHDHNQHAIWDALEGFLKAHHDFGTGGVRLDTFFKAFKPGQPRDHGKFARAAVEGELAQTADPHAKDFLESALFNSDPDDHKDLARELASMYAHAHDGGHADAAGALARALAHVGAEPHGPEPGEPVTHKGSHYYAPVGMFPGDSAVVSRQPVVHSDGSVLAKGAVTPASHAKAVDAPAGALFAALADAYPAGGVVMKAGKHAPKGGISIGGKMYHGGFFIPGDVVKNATPEEKKELRQKTAAAGKGEQKIRTAKAETARQAHADAVSDGEPEHRVSWLHERALAAEKEAGIEHEADVEKPKPRDERTPSAAEAAAWNDLAEAEVGTPEYDDAKARILAAKQDASVAQPATVAGSKVETPGDSALPAPARKPVDVDGTHALADRVRTLTGARKREALAKLADRLQGHTVAELNDLKKRLGFRASGPKAELARKLAARAAATERTSLREFAPAGGRLGVDEAHAMITDHLDAGRMGDPKTRREVADAIESRMSVKDLHALKAKLGLKASGEKYELAMKIAARAGAKPVAREPEAATAEAAGGGLADLPDSIRDQLKGHIGRLNDHAANLGRARDLDKKLRGEGRYEHESHATIDRASADKFLTQFRELAAANGIDAGRAIREAGGIPDLSLSPDGQSWRNDIVASAADKARRAAANVPAPPVAAPAPTPAPQPRAPRELSDQDKAYAIQEQHAAEGDPEALRAIVHDQRGVVQRLKDGYYDDEYPADKRARMLKDYETRLAANERDLENEEGRVKSFRSEIEEKLLAHLDNNKGKHTADQLGRAIGMTRGHVRGILADLAHEGEITRHFSEKTGEVHFSMEPFEPETPAPKKPNAKRPAADRVRATAPAADAPAVNAGASAPPAGADVSGMQTTASAPTETHAASHADAATRLASGTVDDRAAERGLKTLPEGAAVILSNGQTGVVRHLPKQVGRTGKTAMTPHVQVGDNPPFAYAAKYVEPLDPSLSWRASAAGAGAPPAVTTALARMPEAAPAVRSNAPPNTVGMAVRDRAGAHLGWITEPHDGTKDGMRAAADKLTARADNEFGDWSNIQSHTAATGADGRVSHAISPNRNHVSPVGTDAARYTWGDLSAAPKTPKPLPSPASAPPAGALPVSADPPAPLAGERAGAPTAAPGTMARLRERWMQPNRGREAAPTAGEFAAASAPAGGAGRESGGSLSSGLDSGRASGDTTPVPPKSGGEVSGGGAVSNVEVKRVGGQPGRFDQYVAGKTGMFIEPSGKIQVDLHRTSKGETNSITELAAQADELESLLETAKAHGANPAPVTANPVAVTPDTHGMKFAAGSHQFQVHDRNNPLNASNPAEGEYRALGMGRPRSATELAQSVADMRAVLSAARTHTEAAGAPTGGAAAGGAKVGAPTMRAVRVSKRQGTATVEFAPAVQDGGVVYPDVAPLTDAYPTKDGRWGLKERQEGRKGSAVRRGEDGKPVTFDHFHEAVHFANLVTGGGGEWHAHAEAAGAPTGGAAAGGAKVDEQPDQFGRMPSPFATGDLVRNKRTGKVYQFQHAHRDMEGIKRANVRTLRNGVPFGASIRLKHDDIEPHTNAGA